MSIGRDVLNIRMLQEGMLEIPQHLQHVRGHKEAKVSTKKDINVTSSLSLSDILLTVHFLGNRRGIACRP